MKKRILALVLALTMAFSLLVFPASAADTDELDSGEYNGFTWLLTRDGTLTISGEGWLDSGVKDKWFEWVSMVKTIIIEPGITGLGWGAFSDCPSVESISIPDSVTEIDGGVFINCTSLKNVNIPTGISQIRDSLFQNCSSLETVTIPDSVTSIEGYAFCDCSSLTSVVIPDSVTRIGVFAFGNCTSLTSVNIPNGVTSIGNQAFSWCSSLNDVTIPASVTSIGKDVFRCCLNLSRIDVAEGNEKYQSDDGVLLNKVGTRLICCPAGRADDYTIPDSVILISENAFINCNGCKSVVIPESVTTIGNSAFYDCSNLRDVYYNGLQDQWNSISIGESNDPLTNATIHFADGTTSNDPVPTATPMPTPEPTPAPTSGSCGENTWWNYSDGILTISGKGPMWNFLPYDPNDPDAPGWGDELAPAFPDDAVVMPWLGHRDSIQTVVIESGVTAIGNWAFTECRNLTEIYIPVSVTYIGYYPFVGYDNYWGFLNDVYYDGTNEQWTQIDIAIIESIGCPVTSEPTIHTQPEAPVETPYPTTEPTPPMPPLDYYTEVSNSRANLAWLLWRIGGSPYYERENAPFTDIDYLDDEHYSAVRWVYDNEIMRGFEDGSFQPDNKITRAEVATIFYRLEGAPDIGGDTPNPFRDVSKDSWYYQAVVWYAQYPDRFGDYSATNFAPDECSNTFGYDPNTGKFTMSWDHHDALEPPLTERTTVGATRAEIVWLMWRINGAPDYTYRSSYFYDISPSDYYYSAVIWAVDQGITNGTSATTFSPNASCTRAQLATFLYRYSGMPYGEWANPFVDVYEGSYYYDAVRWFAAQQGWGEYTDTHFYPDQMPDSVSYDPNTGAWTLTLATPFYYYIDNGEAVITGYDESRIEGTDVVIPETLGGCPVTRIDGYAFRYQSLTSLTIPATVTDIAYSAFAYANHLTDFYVAEDNPNFAAVDGCLVSKDGTVLVAVPCGLTGEFTTPEGVTEVGINAFEGCQMDSVTLAEGVTRIGVNGFANCYMRELDLPSTLTEIGDYAISGCPLEYVTYHGGRLEWSRVKIGSENFSLQNAKITFLNEDPNAPAGLSYEIVDGEAYITGCDQHLAGTLTIPETLEGCPVVGIRFAAFDSCQKLTAITLPDTVRTIEDYAFIRCSDLQQIAIPEGVERIGVCAFDDCASLTTVTIPRSVTFIDVQAFDGTRVKNIYYGGTEEMWDDVIIKVGNERLYRAAVHFPPIVIVNGPEKATVLPTDQATFHVDVSGTDLTYQWQYKSPAGSAWKNSSSKTLGYNTDTLTVEATSGTVNRNGYQYRCVVTDAAGNTVISEPATMHVVSFAILTQPVDAYVAGSKTATFQVGAIGEGLTYQWQYLNTSGVWKNCSASTAGYNTAELKVVGASGKTNRDGYQYRCVVTDANGNTATSDAATLTVFAIKTQPAGATAVGSDYATFRVNATGTDLTYRWQYKNASGIWKNCTSATMGYNSSELTVQGVTGKTNRNGYQYRCVVKDAEGNTITSNAAELTVLAIKTQPKAATVTGSDKATFKVVATGADLTYQWQYMNASGVWKNCSAATQGYNTDTLTVAGVSGKTNRNGYQYRCVITSGDESITSNAAKLTVK